LFVYLEALVVTRKDFTIYLVFTGLFGVFSWVIFLCKFNLREKISPDKEEDKEVHTPKDNIEENIELQEG
jgi:hypothetical protein